MVCPHLTLESLIYCSGLEDTALQLLRAVAVEWASVVDRTGQEEGLEDFEENRAENQAADDEVVRQVVDLEAWKS